MVRLGMIRVLIKQLKGDLSGALANAIVVIPMAIGYGVIVLATLGPDYSSKGALMGLYAVVFCGFFSALVGRTPVQMSGPKAPLALVVASLAAGLAASLLEVRIPKSWNCRIRCFWALKSSTPGLQPS